MDSFSHVGARDTGARPIPCCGAQNGNDTNKGVGKVAIKNLSAAELSLERLTLTV